MPSDEMVEKACAAYWEQYREAWRPLGLLSSEFDVPFADLPPNTKHLTAKAMEAALSTAHAEPVAWEYELATTRASDGTCGGWKPHVARTQPCVPPDAIRNLTPLYASPSEAAIRADEREKCALMAESYADGKPWPEKQAAIATAIRARGES